MADHDDWEILDGPVEIDPEGRDSSVFGFLYRIGEDEQTATVTLSGTVMASTEGLTPVLAEMVWSKGRTALIASLRQGKRPRSITVFSEGRILEDL
jgi:hypothetical protein